VRHLNRPLAWWSSPNFVAIPLPAMASVASLAPTTSGRQQLLRSAATNKLSTSVRYVTPRARVARLGALARRSLDVASAASSSGNDTADQRGTFHYCSQTTIHACARVTASHDAETTAMHTGFAEQEVPAVAPCCNDSEPSSSSDSIQPVTALMLASILGVFVLASTSDPAAAATDAGASHTHWAPVLGEPLVHGRMHRFGLGRISFSLGWC